MMQEKQVKKIFKFSVIGIISLIIIIKSTLFIIKSGETDIIAYGKIEAMISKDTYSASNKVTNVKLMEDFQESFNNDLMTHCEERSVTFNPNEYLKFR